MCYSIHLWLLLLASSVCFGRLTYSFLLYFSNLFRWEWSIAHDREEFGWTRLQPAGQAIVHLTLLCLFRFFCWLSHYHAHLKFCAYNSCVSSIIHLTRWLSASIRFVWMSIWMTIGCYYTCQYVHKKEQIIIILFCPIWIWFRHFQPCRLIQTSTFRRFDVRLYVKSIIELTFGAHTHTPTRQIWAKSNRSIIIITLHIIGCVCVLFVWVYIAQSPHVVLMCVCKTQDRFISQCITDW